MPSEAQRLRLPVARARRFTHGSARERRESLAADQVGAACGPPRFAARDALADVAARPARARSRGRRATDGFQSRCAPNTPDQACAIATPRVAGHSSCSRSVEARRRAQCLDLAVAVGAASRSSTGGRGRRSRSARRRCAGCRRTTCAASAIVSAPAQPISAQRVVRQRLGHDHRRAQRHAAARARPGEVRRVALGRAHDPARARTSPCGVRATPRRDRRRPACPRRSARRAARRRRPGRAPARPAAPARSSASNTPPSAPATRIRSASCGRLEPARRAPSAMRRGSRASCAGRSRRASAPPLWKSRSRSLGGADPPDLVDRRRRSRATRARVVVRRRRRRRDTQPPLRPEAP